MAYYARGLNGRSLGTTGAMTVRSQCIEGILIRIYGHAHATLPLEEANKAWDALVQVLVPLYLPASVEDGMEPNLVLAQARAPKDEMELSR